MAPGSEFTTQTWRVRSGYPLSSYKETSWIPKDDCTEIQIKQGGQGQEWEENGKMLVQRPTREMHLYICLQTGGGNSRKHACACMHMITHVHLNIHKLTCTQIYQMIHSYIHKRVYAHRFTHACILPRHEYTHLCYMGTHIHMCTRTQGSLPL